MDVSRVAGYCEYFGNYTAILGIEWLKLSIFGLLSDVDVL
jgi:hypothetical protein